MRIEWIVENNISKLNWFQKRFIKLSGIKPEIRCTYYMLLCSGIVMFVKSLINISD
jgi:hypothetical protein